MSDTLEGRDRIQDPRDGLMHIVKAGNNVPFFSYYIVWEDLVIAMKEDHPVVVNIVQSNGLLPPTANVGTPIYVRDDESLYIFDVDEQWVKIKAELGPVNWIDLVGQSSLPAESPYRLFADDLAKAVSFYTHIAGLPPQRVNREQIARVYNESGALIPKGSVVYIDHINLTEGVGTIELAIADNRYQAERTIGITLHDMANNSDGIVGRFTFLSGVDTSSFNDQDILYLSDTTPGAFTNVRPNSPSYTVKIGVASYIHATNGVIGIEINSFTGNDTEVNIDGAFNGVVTETPKVSFYESGGNVYAEVTNEKKPTRNLNFMLDGMSYKLNTTSGGGPNGGAFAMLTPGADAETLFENFIYVWLNNGTPELKISTLGTTDELAPIGKASIFNVARTLTEGIYKWRRFNDAPNNGVFDGVFRWLLDVIRDKLGTTFTSGIDATVTVDSIPTVKVETTAGVAMQAHKGTFTAQDGTKYWIYNNNANEVTYEFTNNLASIVETATGLSLANNSTYYRLPVFGMQNSTSEGALASIDRLLVTRPLGFYTTQAEASLDVSNFDVNPNDIITEGVLFPLYTLVIGRTGGSGSTWTLIRVIDNRTRKIGGAGGGGASGTGGGTDDKVRVTANDSTNSYLNDKIAVGLEFVKTILNPAGNESLQLTFKGWIYNVGRTFYHALVSTATAIRTINLPDADGDLSVNVAEIKSTFDAVTTAGDPGAGFFRLNGVQNALYISYTQNQGSNIKTILEKLGNGSVIKIQSGANKYKIINVTGAYTDMTTWASMPITVDNEGDALVDGDLCGLLVVGGGGINNESVLKIWSSEVLIDNNLQHVLEYTQTEIINFTRSASAQKINGVETRTIITNGGNINLPDSDFNEVRNDYKDLLNPVGRFRLLMANMSDDKIDYSIYKLGDILFPLITSASVESATPSVLTIVFSEPVDIVDLTGLSLNFTVGTAKTISSITSGSGTDTLVFALSADIQIGDEFTFDADATNTITNVSSSNSLASVSFSVANNVASVAPDFLFKSSDPTNDFTKDGSEVISVWHDTSVAGEYDLAAVNSPEYDPVDEDVDFKADYNAFFNDAMRVRFSKQQDFTIVFKVNLTSTANQEILSVDNGSGDRTGIAILSGALAGGYYEGTWTTKSGAATTGEHTLTLINDSGAITFRIDGANQVGTALTIVEDIRDKCYVGALDGVNFPFLGSMSLFKGVYRVLSGVELTNFEL